ncbi:hypothetical protein HGA64_03340 [Candidatus Falkowbacteria bacterium]|nr:hypothetical protein [Candidatus Falkowbacteria bacterium]
MLDDLNRIKQFDTGKVAESISSLAEQMQQVLEEAKLIKIPESYKDITQIVVKGMGGSNLGAHIIKDALADKLPVPLNISAGYDIPASVNSKTLYVLSSYSGTTEEVLSVYNEVKKREAKIIAIVSEGNSQLEKIIKDDNIPAYIFKPKYNPSNQPRLGLGYSIFGIASLLSSTGIFDFDRAILEGIIRNLQTWDESLQLSTPTKNNPAKTIASAIYKKQPILVGAEFIGGNLRAFRNQICENSKNFASFLVLPDLNHFAMEGLANPASNTETLSFVFFDSNLYHPRIQKRARLTKEVIKNNNIPVIEHLLMGETPLEQSFELLQLGSWTSFYLGILNQVNPVEIKWVDWFKQKLAEN